MTLKDIIATATARESALAALERDLLAYGRSLGPALAREVMSYLESMETSGGRLTFSPANIRAAASSGDRLRGWLSARGVGAASRVINTIESTLGINLEYFRRLLGVGASRVQASVALRTFTHIGFDSETREVLPGSALQQVIDGEAVAQTIISIVQTAVATKTPLAEVRDRITEVVDPADARGTYERFLYGEGGDLASEADRVAHKTYADDLGLRFAYYSGTAKNNTRDFCLERLNLLYDSTEIEKWQLLEWKGKKKVHDIWADVGGYNCRHHFSFVSEELVKVLGKPVNTYHKTP